MPLSWHPFSALSARRPRPSATAGLLALAGVGAGFWWTLRGSGAPEAAAAVREYGALSAEGLREGRLWQPLTALFLPGSALWLVCVYAPLFWLAGRHLERVVGRRHVVALFFLAGVSGGLAQAAYDGWIVQRAGATSLLGMSAPLVAVFTALAGIVPDLELVPPLTLSTGSHGPAWLRIKHGAVAGLAGLGVALLARPQGAFASEQAVRCLVSGLAGCLYVRQLGFGRRARPAGPVDDPDHAATAAAAEAAAEAVSTWTDKEPHPTVVAAPVAAAAGALVVPRFTERERRMTARDFITEQIDPILEKISRHGLGSLTADERRVLEKGREKIVASSERRK